MMFSFLSLLSLAAISGCSAWTAPLSVPRSVTTTGRFTTRLYNVPPPSLNDVAAFKEYADKQAPPASFFELQQDCIKAAQLALRDGHKLLEVEFPPLPANVLEMDDVSAYEIANANLNLALDFSKGILSASQNDDQLQAFQKIAILLPDEAEAEIATEKMLGGSKNPYPGITVSALRQSEEGDDRIFKVRTITEHGRCGRLEFFLPSLYQICVQQPARTTIFESAGRWKWWFGQTRREC